MASLVVTSCSERLAECRWDSGMHSLLMFNFYHPALHCDITHVINAHMCSVLANPKPAVSKRGARIPETLFTSGCPCKAQGFQGSGPILQAVRSKSDVELNVLTASHMSMAWETQKSSSRTKQQHRLDCQSIVRPLFVLTACLLMGLTRSGSCF